MYCAPDFVKVELMRNGVFASGCEECDPGTKLNDIDYSGSDLSGCHYATIAGQVYEWQCYYDSDPPGAPDY